MHWAAFQYDAKLFGATCRCSCVLVHAASGAIESVRVTRRSTPSMSMSMSSPRAAKI
jgi:hypothetical protein